MRFGSIESNKSNKMKQNKKNSRKYLANEYAIILFLSKRILSLVICF